MASSVQSCGPRRKEWIPWLVTTTRLLGATTKSQPVTEDLVRYMNYAMSETGNFLVEDPLWAVDFAPNGMCDLSNDVCIKLVRILEADFAQAPWSNLTIS
jgi:hypothetical protein